MGIFLGSCAVFVFLTHEELSEMLINKWRDAILFEGDSGDGSGEGSGTGSDDFDKTRAMATIEKLRGFEKEAKRLQKLNEQHEAKIAELSVRTILDAEQEALWTEYQKLGAVKDITTALQERDASKAELTMLKRQRQVNEIAEKVGFVPAVFSQLDAMEVLTYEEKTVTVDNKPAQVIMVSGGKANQAMPLQEYASTHWKDFLPALQPGEATRGVQFAPQRSGENRQFLTPEEIAKKQRNSGSYYAL